MNITLDRLIASGRDLVSEAGENPEYDRAIVELTATLLNLCTDEHRETVAALVGVTDAAESRPGL